MGAFLSIIFGLCRRRAAKPVPVQQIITPEKWDDIRHQESSAPILIFGRFESPRADFIDTACKCMVEVKPEANLKASDVSIKNTAVDDHPFKLINAPGFDSPYKSNLEVFMDIAQYLQSGEVKSGVKGIIYVHDVNDALQSRFLAENLNVLFGVLLGQSALRLLTILVVPSHSTEAEYCTSIVAKMQTPDSVFSTAQKAGARIMTSRLGETDVSNLLREFYANDPVQLQIQRERPSDLQQAIEQALGYSDTSSVKNALARQEEATTKMYRPDLLSTQKELAVARKVLEETRRALGESQQKAERYQGAYRQLEMQLGTEQKRVQDLNRRLQETQSEYSSLRSQLQIQENVEQSEIVLGLKDLNRAIEDIGRAFSAHLADHYANAAFGKDVTEVTTLDARDITTLQVTFGHVEESASFVKSSSGEGMLVEDFFDYGIRHLLCSFLWQRIFSVFHPGINDAHDQMLTGIYQGIQQREAQAVAAKWRVNSFLSIELGPNSEQAKKGIIANHTKEFCEGIIANARAFFGQDQDIQLEPTHFAQVEKLIQMAWEWNAKLMGEVIVLGDFIQTFYGPRTVFDPNAMDEFEPRRGFKAEAILGTLGLGLISAQAVGGGQPPQMTLVCKPTVATESLYS